MIFIGLSKMKKKPSKESFDQATEIINELKNRGVKIIGWYLTLGRYDTVLIYEAKDEKEALKISLAGAGLVAPETLVAIPRDEALSLL